MPPPFWTDQNARVRPGCLFRRKGEVGFGYDRPSGEGYFFRGIDDDTFEKIFEYDEANYVMGCSMSDTYDQALAELAKLPKDDARYPKSQSVATLQHNRARSLMALGQFLAARNGLLEACLAAGGDAKYPVAADRRAECDAKLLEHAKAAEAWESLADDTEDATKARTWRSKAQAERAKASRRPHELLGLESPRCSPAELKKAYRKKSLQWNPDRQASGTPEHKYRAHLMFQRISAAHDELQESSSRPRYATYWSEESEGSEQESEEEDLYESTPAWTRYFDRAKARS